MKYLFVCLFLVFSCEETHRYSSSEIGSIELSEKNLIGKRPSLISEPFFVHEAIENKLIDTPIRIIGKIDEVLKSELLLEEGGKSLLVRIDGMTSILKENNLVLVEGILTQRKNEFQFNAETLVVLDMN